MATIDCVKCGQTKDIKHFHFIGSDNPKWEHGALQWEDKCNDCLGLKDSDLYYMTPYELLQAALAMRAAIRTHRDASGHDLCWYVPELWDVLPDKVSPKPDVPATGEFLNRCKQYRASLETK